MSIQKNKKEKNVEQKNEKKLTAEGWKRQQMKEHTQKMDSSSKKNTA